MSAKPFSHTLQHVLEYSKTDLDQHLGELLAQCLDATESRAVATKLTVTLDIKPDDGGRAKIRVQPKTAIPEEPRGSTIVWVSPEGNPLLEHPDQGHLELDDGVTRIRGDR